MKGWVGKWLDGIRWMHMYSHPVDFTPLPVCTPSLIARWINAFIIVDLYCTFIHDLDQNITLKLSQSLQVYFLQAKQLRKNTKIQHLRPFNARRSKMQVLEFLLYRHTSAQPFFRLHKCRGHNPYLPFRNLLPIYYGCIGFQRFLMHFQSSYNSTNSSSRCKLIVIKCSFPKIIR